MVWIWDSPLSKSSFFWENLAEILAFQRARLRQRHLILVWMRGCDDNELYTESYSTPYSNGRICK